MHGEAMVMGDLVLLETEINPVMSKLLDGGIEITAIHNHLLRASPATFYMHIGGHGDPVKMAEAIRRRWRVEQDAVRSAAGIAAPAPAIDLDTAQLDQIIGVKGHGQWRRLPVQHAAARSDYGGRHGGAAGHGLANAINFQPTGGGKAAITGDFVMTGDEVNPVIRALRPNGIEVTAIHSHMLDEQPRMFFMHFWANDDALKLAQAASARRSTRPPWRSADLSSAL